MSERLRLLTSAVRRLPPRRWPASGAGWASLPLRLIGTLTVFVLSILILSIATLAVIVLGATLLLGLTGTPDSLLWDNLLAAGVFLAIGLVVGTATALVTRWMFGVREPRLAAGMAFGALLLALATQRATPVPFDHFAFSLERLPGALRSPPDLRHDILLVVDPDDPAAQRLLREAAARGPGVAAAPPGARWDVRIGVASVGGNGGWSMVQPPTADRARVGAALSSIEAARATDPTPVAFAVNDAVTGRRGRWWRDGTHRSVVLVMDRRPKTAELSPLANVLWDQTRDALNVAPLSNIVPRPDETELVVVTSDAPPLSPDFGFSPRLRPPARYVSPPEPRSGRSALQAAERAVVSPVEPADEGLAFKYRPHLLFDSAERFLPIDVDAMLSERDRSGRPVHRVCTVQAFVISDDCRPAASAYDLTRPGSYLDIAGDRRNGAGLPRELADGLPRQPRMYFDIRRLTPRRVEIDYWWFLRFNVSPVRERNLCLAGLSIVEVTCFDHEGDWEGLTVSLSQRDDGPAELEAVTYDAHGIPHRYDRARIAELRLLRDDTHPAVYSAYGSHASYPTECRGDGTVLGGCWQDGRLDLPWPLGSTRLPEGRHDGDTEWPENTDSLCRAAHCLVPLPTRFPGGGALWNTFRGTWGAARCTIFVKLCVRAPGPDAPALQR